MTEIQNLLNELSASEKLAAIDFLWSKLEPDLDVIPSPDWHGAVLTERLSNPSPHPPLELDDAIARIQERVRASKNSDGSGA